MKSPVYVMVDDELIKAKKLSGYKWEKLIELGIEGVETRNRLERTVKLIDDQAKEIQRLKDFIRTGQNQ